jgi:hypothetical protein
MKIQNYLKLEKTFTDRTFEGKYKILDLFLNASSYLGNIASVFFAYFFLSDILFRATDDFFGRTFGIIVVSITALSMFEMIKRFVLKNLSLSVIQSKFKLNTEVIYNTIFSLILLTGTFYLSVSGAHKFSDKKETIQQEVTTSLSSKTDSINVLYDKKIQYKINERNQLIKNRNIYNNKISETSFTVKLKEYSGLIQEANNEIKRADNEISVLNKQKNEDIEFIKGQLSENSEEQNIQIGKNQFAFILLSSFIELLIMVGIWFHNLYKLRVFQEYRQNMANNSNYEMYVDYTKILSIIYLNGKIQVQQEIPSMSALTTTIRKREEFPVSYIKDFFNTCKSLGILSTNSKKKNIVLVKYEDAKQLILNNFDQE